MTLAPLTSLGLFVATNLLAATGQRRYAIKRSEGLQESGLFIRSLEAFARCCLKASCECLEAALPIVAAPGSFDFARIRFANPRSAQDDSSQSKEKNPSL
jgi:hypothetical protein